MVGRAHHVEVPHDIDVPQPLQQLDLLLCGGQRQPPSLLPQVSSTQAARRCAGRCRASKEVMADASMDPILTCLIATNSPGDTASPAEASLLTHLA